MRLPLQHHSAPWRSVFLLLLGALINAYNVENQLQPIGPLGVTLDRSFAISIEGGPSAPDDPKQKPLSWVFSSHIRFNGPVNGPDNQISDQQLVQLAMDGFNEVEADRIQYGAGPGVGPAVMTVIATGNELIFSSSMRGRESFTYSLKDSPVVDSLRLCQAVWKDDGPGKGHTDVEHRAKGKCGEVMAAHMWYRRNPNSNTFPRGTRVTTIGPNPDDPQGGLKVYSACGFERKKDIWGCNLFIADQRMQEILGSNAVPAPYVLQNLAGGVAQIDQIRLCE